MAARRSAGKVTWVSTRSLALPRTYLRDVGVAAQQTRPREDAWADVVAQAYRRYLCEERGLAAETQRAYLRIAGVFCQSVPGGWDGLGELRAQDVSSYVVAASRAGSVAAAQHALLAYRRDVERAIPRPVSTSLLVSIRGTRLCPSAVHPTLRAIVSQAGLHARGTRCRPRLHDARHSFAVRALIGWYEDGADVDAKLPLLSAFLGHADPASTYWYLQAAPELFSRVAERLDHLLGASS